MKAEDIAIQNITPVPGLYGLVICGGNSRRMGIDKSMIEYYGKPQCYHVYEILSLFCERVFISCNDRQANVIDPAYETLVDIDPYSGTGPLAGLITAFTNFPNHHFLLVGCDYPFIDRKELSRFLPFCKPENPAAFYNEKENMYEPVLAYYPPHSKKKLLELFKAGKYSLQFFLKEVMATKFYPQHEKMIVNVNTKNEYLEAMKSILAINVS